MVSSQLNVGIKHCFSSNCGIAATQNFHEESWLGPSETPSYDVKNGVY